MQRFFCYHAIDSHKGIYYDFDWEEHRREALRSGNFWDSGRQWDISASNLPETPQKHDTVTSMYFHSGRQKLQAVQEEEEEEPDPEKSEGEVKNLDSPTKRKRKRKRAMQEDTPVKRARSSASQAADERNGEVMEVSQRSPNPVEVPGAHIPQTPSRRGRRRATTISSSSRRKANLNEVDGSELSQHVNHGARVLEHEGLAEHNDPNVTNPHAALRRGRTKTDVKLSTGLVEVTSDDGAEDPDYKAQSPTEDTTDVDEDDDYTKAIPKTPSKRNRTSTTTTPRKKRTATAAPTPHSKAALRARASRKRALAIRPPPPGGTQNLKLQLASISEDPWLRAMHVLHVAAQPDSYALPCREEEYAKVLRAVEELLEEGSGGCICEHSRAIFEDIRLTSGADISGVPGTGKTATVHAVVRELKRMAEQNVCTAFERRKIVC